MKETIEKQLTDGNDFSFFCLSKKVSIINFSPMGVIVKERIENMHVPDFSYEFYCFIGLPHIR